MGKFHLSDYLIPKCNLLGIFKRWMEHIPKIMDSKSTIKFHKQPVPMEYKRDAWRRGVDIYSGRQGEKASDDASSTENANCNQKPLNDIYLLAPPSTLASRSSSSGLYLTVGLVVGGFVYFSAKGSEEGERREGLVQSAAGSLAFALESVAGVLEVLYQRSMSSMSRVSERMALDPGQIARRQKEEEYMTEDADDWISLYNMAKEGGGVAAKVSTDNNADQKETAYSPLFPQSSASMVIRDWLKSGLPVLYWQTADPPIPLLHLSAMIHQENADSSAHSTTDDDGVKLKKPLIVHCSANETAPSFSVNRIVRGWLKLEDETGEQDRILLDDRFPEGWKTSLARALEKGSPPSSTYYFVVELTPEFRGPVRLDERRMQLFDHLYDLITMLQEKQCKLIIISHEDRRRGKEEYPTLGSFLSLDSGRRVYISK